MTSDNAPSIKNSTIVRRGRDAVNFIEMANFVYEMESRSLDRLLTDLPGLLELTESKFGLVAKVLRRRMQHSPESRNSLLVALGELERTAPTPQIRGRCQGLLQPRA